MKFLKCLVGVGLLFPCVLGTQLAWSLLLAAARSHAGTVMPLPAIALFTGFFLWILVFTLFPHPLRTYVFAHEVSHAIWAILMGASVSRLRVRATHGSVTLSKTHFLISLAPYFFPLYTVLVILVYAALSLFVAVESYQWLWLALVGYTWSFHLCFTINALMQHQTDIQQQGHLFSYTVIYLANLAGICLWIILVSDASFEDAVRALLQHTINMATFLQQVLYPWLQNNLEKTLSHDLTSMPFIR